MICFIQGTEIRQPMTSIRRIAATLAPGASPARLLHAGIPTQRIGVIGLGLMGHGIAQATAEKGFDVVAVELEEKYLDAGAAEQMGSLRDSCNIASRRSCFRGWINCCALSLTGLGRIKKSLTKMTDKAVTKGKLSQEEGQARLRDCSFPARQQWSSRW